MGVEPIVEQLKLTQVLRCFLGTSGDVWVSIVAKDDQTLLKLFADTELDIVVGPFSASEQSTDHDRGFEMVSDNIVAVVRAAHPMCGRKNGRDLYSMSVDFAQSLEDRARAEYPRRF